VRDQEKSKFDWNPSTTHHSLNYHSVRFVHQKNTVFVSYPIQRNQQIVVEPTVVDWINHWDPSDYTNFHTGERRKRENSRLNNPQVTRVDFDRLWSQIPFVDRWDWDHTRNWKVEMRAEASYRIGPHGGRNRSKPVQELDPWLMEHTLFTIQNIITQTNQIRLRRIESRFIKPNKCRRIIVRKRYIQ